MQHTHAHEQYTHDRTTATALEERVRLARLCARLTGNADNAEDLAHETLVVALRAETRLRDPARRPQWLAGIARNVCRRWAYQRGREIGVSVAGLQGVDESTYEVADHIDLERTFETRELADLLDRALTLLPPETRDVLIQTYVDETPRGEIGARLGLSADAVSMRLTRGKRALRHALTTDLRDQVAPYIPYGLLSPVADAWQETRLWCSLCGRHRLQGRFTPAEFALRCPACFPGPAVFFTHTTSVALLDGVTGYGPANNRVTAWVGRHIRPALPARVVACAACGAPSPLRLGPHGPVTYYIDFSCPACGAVGGMSLGGLLPALPDGRRFWRAHPRLRKLPERVVEADGRPAVVTSFESVTAPARIDLVSALDTYEPLSVHVAGLPHDGA